MLCCAVDFTDATMKKLSMLWWRNKEQPKDEFTKIALQEHEKLVQYYYKEMKCHISLAAKEGKFERYFSNTESQACIDALKILKKEGFKVKDKSIQRKWHYDYVTIVSWR